MSIIWDVIESKALACNLKIGKGGMRLLGNFCPPFIKSNISTVCPVRISTSTSLAVYLFCAYRTV